MNKLKQTAALKRHDVLKGKSEREILEVLEKDEKLTKSEKKEIAKLLQGSNQDSPSEENQTGEKPIPEVIFKDDVKVNPYEFVKQENYQEDDIPKTRYENENWRKYIEKERSLNGMKEFDFYKVKAIGVFENTQDKFGNPVIALKGITVEGKPICKTRIMANMARMMNDQIWNSPNNKDASVYYLYADAVEI